MLPRVVLLIWLASIGVAYANSDSSRLVGRWLWHGVDAETVLTFREDHTYLIEQIGQEHRESRKGTWQIDRKQLTVCWPDRTKSTEAIVTLTLRKLSLRSKDGRLTFSRIE